MKKLVRVVVAEDDRTQADRLVQMLAELEPSWQVVACVSDWRALKEAVDELAPQVVMLDIHMPGGGELSTVKALDPKPEIIVTTGDPTLALDAFNTEVVDYLLKPITMGRLLRATRKAQALLEKVAPVARVDQADAQRWLVAVHGNDSVVVSLREIIYLQAERKYTRLITKEGEALLRTGISEAERHINSPSFVRVHRSTVINVHHVKLLRRDEMGRLRVHLNGRDERPIVSRPYESQFKSL